MKVTFKKDWQVFRGSRRSQAAAMKIPRGDAEGGPNNKHSGDQWLYAINGTGTAILNGRSQKISRGTLIFIPASTKHEIKNTGRKPLKTLNFYAPPQY